MLWIVAYKEEGFYAEGGEALAPFSQRWWCPITGDTQGQAGGVLSRDMEL